MKLVKVIWKDITALTDWCDENKIDETDCDVCIITGYLYSDGDPVKIACVRKQDITEDDNNYDCVYIIPRGAIIKIEEI